MTEEENMRLLALMSEQGETNFSAYARKKLFNNELESWTVSFPEYEQLTEQFTQIGTISPEDFIELGQLMMQVMDVVEKELLVKPKNSK